jgi:hypothetical protein
MWDTAPCQVARDLPKFGVQDLLFCAKPLPLLTAGAA